MIDPEDMHLFHITDQADEAVAQITKFYRRYHSSRYVEDKFVLRLNHPLPAETLAEINDTFGDLIISGRFEQLDHPLEGEDGVFPAKPRLTFLFNRCSAGRLRMLIDRINEGP